MSFRDDHRFRFCASMNDAVGNSLNDVIGLEVIELLQVSRFLLEERDDTLENILI